MADIQPREEFRSDFDILIIIKKDLGEDEGALSMYLTDVIKKKKKMEAPLSLIIENLDHVNTMLKMGRYFYADIQMEGVLLFDNSGIDLAEKKVITEKERLEMMKEDYEMWFPSGNEFFIDYNNAFERGNYNKSAFYLHQTTEMYMTAYLLVKTLYKPKTHDLDLLYYDLQKNDSRFKNWFDFKDLQEFGVFQLLREAYVRARYDKNYNITKEELEFLVKKVLFLRDLIEKLCNEEIGKLK